MGYLCVSYLRVLFKGALAVAALREVCTYCCGMMRCIEFKVGAKYLLIVVYDRF